MALPSPFVIREILYEDKGSTFPTAFTDADSADWTNNGVKLRAIEPDFSSLTYASVADPAIQSRFMGRPARIETLRGGVESMTLKFKMHLAGGSATTSPTALSTLLGVTMGGITSPSAITDTAETASTATAIVCTGHGQNVGQASLFGADGDGKADGQVGVIKTRSDADNYALLMALPGAPTNGDAIKNGHSLFVDWTDESYVNFLVSGHYAGSGAADDPDIINLMGCSGTVTFGGFAPGETPFAEFEFAVADWRNEPYASTKALALTTSPSGGDPVGSRAIGALTIGDLSSTTRTTVRGGAIEINPNMQLAFIEDRNGVNGVGGWLKVPSETGPTFSVTRYWGDMPGLYNDFIAGTSKQIMFAMGNTAQNVVAFDLQNALLDSVPMRAEFNSSLGCKLDFHGETGTAGNESTALLKLQDAPLRVHQI